MKNKSEMKQIFKLLGKHKVALTINVILTVLTFAIFIIIPLLEQKIIDEGFINKDYRFLIRLVVISVLLSLVTYIVAYIQSYLQSDMVVKCRAELKNEALKHGMRLKMKYVKEKGLHSLITDANNDINVITQIFSSNLTFLVIEFLKIIGYTIGLLFLSWQLTLYVIVIIPIKIIIASIVGRLKTKKIQALIDIQKEISQWQSDFYPGVNEIKNWNMYHYIEKEYSQLVIKKEKISKSVDIFVAIDTLLKYSSEKLLFGGLYILAAVFIWRNELTIGSFFAFTTFASSLFYPIDIVTNIKVELSEIIPSIKSYQQFIELEEESFDGKAIENSSVNEFRLENVSFSYGEQQILKDFSITLNGKEKTAIIGKNGSGKSTISNLMLRYIEPDVGKIMLNGKDISQYALNDYRNLFSVMNQTVYLFNDSIENNIFMYKKASKKIEYHGLLSFVSRLKNGMKSSVGLNGGNLSGGEKQRIALYRTLNKDASVVLLDEATSNCDVETEKEFLKILKEFDDKMLLVITHNFSMLKDFDRIIAMDNGNVIADGTYDEISDIIYEMEGSN